MMVRNNTHPMSVCIVMLILTLSLGLQNELIVQNDDLEIWNQSAWNYFEKHITTTTSITVPPTTIASDFYGNELPVVRSYKPDSGSPFVSINDLK